MRFKGVEVIGFDLDGTLYERTPEIDRRIQTRIAQALLEIKPGLKTIEGARAYFEERYNEGRGIGGGAILAEAGYGNKSGEVRERCIASADILDLIHKDDSLMELMNSLRDRYNLCLITSSAREISLQKLERLGLDPCFFSPQVFGDDTHTGNKPDGSAFKYAAKFLGKLANNIAYVGDSHRSDILPAKKTGMKTIIVGRKLNPFEIAEADAHIERVHELRELLL